MYGYGRVSPFGGQCRVALPKDSKFKHQPTALKLIEEGNVHAEILEA
jgi:hypothetical protein